MNSKVVIGLGGIQGIGKTSIMRMAMKLLDENPYPRIIRVAEQFLHCTVYDKSKVAVIGSYPFWYTMMDLDRSHYAKMGHHQADIEGIVIRYISGLPHKWTVWIESSMLVNDIFVGTIRADPLVSSLFLLVTARDEIIADRTTYYDKRNPIQHCDTDFNELREKYDMPVVYNNTVSDIDVLGNFVFNASKSMVDKLVYSGKSARSLSELGY